MFLFLILGLLLIMSILAQPTRAFTIPTYDGTITAVMNITINTIGSTALPKGQAVRIILNTLKNNTYANGGGNNIVIFNGVTGNILNQWYEGNNINPLQTTTLNTVVNYSIWVALPAPISGGVNAVNVMTIGFLSMTSTAMGNSVGESGILSNSISGRSCSQYDNGANVFVVYNSFCGLGASATLPGGWFKSSGAVSATVTYGTTNIVIKTSQASTYAGIYFPTANSLSFNTVGNAIDITAIAQPTSSGLPKALGLTSVIPASGSILSSVQRWLTVFPLSAPSRIQSQTYGSISGVVNVMVPNVMVTGGNALIYSMDYATSSSGNIMIGYNALRVIGTGSSGQVPQIIASAIPQQFIAMTSDATNGITIFNVRTRTLYPSDIAPAQFNGLIQTVSSTTCTFTISNTAINFGSLTSGGTTTTRNAVLITNTGATTSTISLYGTSWSYLSNSFLVYNTVWDWAYGTAYSTANVLQSSSTSSGVSLAGLGTKNIYFGIGIPSVEKSNTYQQTISITNSC